MLYGDEYEVKAEIAQIHGFSGHADQNELLRLLAPQAKTTRQLFLVHGEPEGAAVLAEKCRALGFADVTVAQRGQCFEL